jgi:hypothetical protein
VSRISKKTVAVPTALLLLSGGAAAWAWGSGVSGSGSLQTQEAEHVRMTNDPIVDLWPSFEFTEIPVKYSNFNPGPVYVVDPSVAVGKVTNADGEEVLECGDTNFIIQQVSRETTYSLPPTGEGVFVEWTYEKPLIRLRTNAPDACQGTTVELTYSSDVSENTGNPTDVTTQPTPPTSW